MKTNQNIIAIIGLGYVGLPLAVEFAKKYKVENVFILKIKNSLKEKNQFIRNGKISKYLQQKGFESNLIWELINKDK